MADRSNCFHVVEESTRVAQGHKGLKPSFISTANINFLEEFLVFCKSKKMNEANGIAQEVNGVCNDQDKVVDELCKLVQENLYGKCSFCLLPTESLILSVLQILLDAAQNANKVKEKNVVPLLSSNQQSQ